MAGRYARRCSRCGKAFGTDNRVQRYCTVKCKNAAAQRRYQKKVKKALRLMENIQL